MQVLSSPMKNLFPSCLINLIIILSSSVCIVYLCVSAFLISSSIPLNPSSQNLHAPTNLNHIVFGIASNQKSWQKRKELVQIWWKPNQMRGCVFFDTLPPQEESNTTTSLPPLFKSEDTSRFRYNYKKGQPSAIRVARVVKETVELNHSDVRWFVFGDDDTVFVPENLVKVLAKYDHEFWYYIGSSSEIYEQNNEFGFEMAFGGGGFALSAPLARVLAKVLDSCIDRYSRLYGSDSRVYSCLAELGVALTHEPGFHQIDLRGNMLGFLSSHPLTPLISLHHLDEIDPIYPNMTTTEALKHFFKPATMDSHRILQQTVCYDRWYSWSISISWGYAIQVFEKHVSLPDILPVQKTFRQWKPKGQFLSGVYSFDTREVHPEPCKRPTVFYFDDLVSGRDGRIISRYTKFSDNCSYDGHSPKKLDQIKVFSTKLELDLKQLQAPRRQCCDVLPPSNGKMMEITIRECKQEELIRMQ